MSDNVIVTYKSQSILDSIKLLNKSSKSIIFFVNSKGILIGSLTDGDIRRSLLKNRALNENVMFAINKKCYFVYTNFDNKKVLKKINDQDLIAVPVLKKDKKITNVVYSKNLISKLSNQFVIMAGGRGSRMKPITDTIPKPLVNYKGGVLISKIIDKAYNEGFCNFVISIGYLGHKIQNYLDKKYKNKINLEYIKENTPLGTVGALSLLKKTKKPFIVTNADVITELKYKDLLEFHEQQSSDLTIGTKTYETQIPFGVINIKRNIISQIEEKPKFLHKINAGVYVFKPNLLKSFSKVEYLDLNTFFEKIKNKKKIVSFPIFEKWNDIGNLEDLK